ncbi:MAG: hypothetical protein NTZ26_15345 [Candidatus Aminicenantes bacterium]|nr:hypothetical protein [Candidatus Aminicenantes bacterium]
MSKSNPTKAREPRRKTRQPPAFGLGAGRGGPSVRSWARSKQGRKGGNR